jgi:hypothetical protein
MKRLQRSIWSLMACLAALTAFQPASASDGFCGPLIAFVDSVNPGETRALNFHSILGSNFKDRAEPGFGAKRCDYADYEPAKAVCIYLMEYSAIEFPGHYAKVAIECLSKKTRFPVDVQLHSISVSLKHGLDSRGSLVDIALKEHSELGGLVLTIAATGH